MVTPSEDASRAAVVVIAGVTRPVRSCNADNQYEGCIVARRLVPFIEHTSLTVPIRLEIDCLDVPCDAISTCAKGQCVLSETSCEGSECSKVGVAADGGVIVVEDAATSNDATSPRDATADATDDVTARIDAAPDGGSCTYAPGVACNGGRCQVGQVCCQSATAPFDEACTDPSFCNPSVEQRQLSCRSAADCMDPTQVCCMAPSYMYASCQASCGYDGGGYFGFQTCTAACPSCRFGTCITTPDGYSKCQ